MGRPNLALGCFWLDERVPKNSAQKARSIPKLPKSHRGFRLLVAQYKGQVQELAMSPEGKKQAISQAGRLLPWIEMSPVRKAFHLTALREEQKV